MRNSRDGDVPGMLAIYLHHIRRGVDPGVDGEFETPDADDLKRRRRSMNNRKMPHLVAEEAGTVVGYAYAVPFRKRPAYRYTVKHSIYVRSDRLHAGIGRQLMTALIDACAAAGFRQMIGYIDGANVASIKLHERFGFRQVGCSARGRLQIRPLDGLDHDAALARARRDRTAGGVNGSALALGARARLTPARRSSAPDPPPARRCGPSRFASRPRASTSWAGRASGAEAGALIDLLRHQHFAAERLGQRLERAATFTGSPITVNCAWRSYPMAPAMVMPAWMPMPNGSARPAHGERRYSGFRPGPRLRRWPRSPAGRRRRAGRPMPNKRQEPVAQHLVGLAASADDGAADRVEELVDDEHGVERQPSFGQPARSAHVDKHDDQITLDPRMGGSGSMASVMVAYGDSIGTKAMSRVGRNWQASLTSGPACTRSSTACSAALGCRQAREVAEDADAAGRAAAAAAAHMRVRDVVDEARLEHAEAAGRADRAVGIGEPDRADAALPPRRKPPGAKRGGERRGQEGERPDAVVEEDRVLGRSADVIGRRSRAPARPGPATRSRVRSPP